MMTVAEISGITGFKSRTINEWIRNGYLRSIRGPSKKKPRHYVQAGEVAKLMVKMKMPADIIKKIQEHA